MMNRDCIKGWKNKDGKMIPVVKDDETMEILKKKKKKKEEVEDDEEE